MKTTSPSTGADAARSDQLAQIDAADRRTAQAVARETPRLRAWLRRQARAWQGVDDLLQDLFLELVLANRGARRVENVGAWLFQVARRHRVDDLRQRRALNEAVSVDSIAELPASGPDMPVQHSEPEADYQRSVFSQRLIAALQALPAEQRDVFVAHELDGLSMAEIAARDGIGLNTALARKRYAVLRLRKVLAEFQDLSFPGI